MVCMLGGGGGGGARGRGRGRQTACSLRHMCACLHASPTVCVHACAPRRACFVTSHVCLHACVFVPCAGVLVSFGENHFRTLSSDEHRMAYLQQVRGGLGPQGAEFLCWSVVPLSWLVGWLVSWAAELAGWLVGWLVGLLVVVVQ